MTTTQIKPLSKKWIILAVISMGISPIICNWISEHFNLNNEFFLAAPTPQESLESIKYAIIYLFFSLVLNSPLYLFAFILMHKLKQELVPKNKYFNYLLTIYLGFCLLFALAYTLILAGLMHYNSITIPSNLSTIFSWVEIIIELIMGIGLMIMLFKKRLFTSLLGVAGLIYVSRSLLVLGANVITTHCTTNIFLNSLICSYSFYFFIGFWVIMANHYLAQKRNSTIS